MALLTDACSVISAIAPLNAVLSHRLIALRAIGTCSFTLSAVGALKSARSVPLLIVRYAIKQGRAGIVPIHLDGAVWIFVEKGEL